ncbi:MAG TPA: alkaline phosphatase family protein [Thermoanaerobaculia bacterium]
MPAPKVLFLGLDAADPALVRAWAHQGRLPHLAALLRDGFACPTEGPPGFFVGAHWPSFYTALNPARHGAHCWEQIEPGEYEPRRFLAGERVAGEPFWETLSRAGRRVAVVDVPLSGPAASLNGLQLVEWGSHDPDLGLCSCPPALAGEVAARFGLHPVQGNCNDPTRTAEDFARFRDDLVAGAKRKTDLNLHLLEREPWDLFVSVYSESHCVGHQCWHIHDRSHPRWDAATAERVGDPLLDVYRALDAGVGRTLAAVRPDVAMIFLSHGMGPHYDPTFLLDDVLKQLEVAERLAVPGRALAALEALAARLPGPPGRRLRRAAARRRAALEARAERLRRSLDRPAARRYFHHLNNHVESGIRINLAGREPQGLVEPGRDYARTCARLTRRLLALRDAETGEPMVRDVLRTRDLYAGERLDHLPDLAVRWRRSRQVEALHSPHAGTVRGTYRGPRSGDHTPEGLLLVTGPAVPAGRLDRTVSVMDLAPTLAALLGVELDGVDGRPIAEVVAFAKAPHPQPA